MAKILWTSKNGVWTIETYKDSKQMVSVLGEPPMGSVCEYPIIYDNGTIAYDNPKRVPQYVKRQVEKILKKGKDE